ncbi:3-hydroxybutyryl-CoA dehydrogenase [Burkholderia ambifaria MEX-5]|uniref:3-hydroxybutyryl-CoA dehydrogenase n=2 Tax=Burkholderia ambifaria TaxID=152480 RepID=B1T451_9BURK|nr:3-hydroxybutyryl-CoA dehydrogenase [Burkholderia ambifaria MEX-5]
MGAGIAQMYANAEHTVLLIDVDEHKLEQGLQTIGTSLQRLVAREKVTAAYKRSVLDRIRTSSDYTQLRESDLVVEAATEKDSIKRQILRDVERCVDESAIIATNTSSLSITGLAAAISRQERFIGMHFFNPVPVMPLVELIRGLRTSDETYETAKRMMGQLGKVVVSVDDSPGFVVNRLLIPMINEAFAVWAEGISSPEDIDRGMKLGANHPLGPLALADLIGLDVCLSIMNALHDQFGDGKYRPSVQLRKLVAAGRLGRKTGQGVFDYRT